MNVSTWTHSPSWIAWGWTLLHFLWIGTAFGLLAWSGRLLLKSCRPEMRYVYAVASFAVLAILPPAIWLQLPQESVGRPPSRQDVTAEPQTVAADISASEVSDIETATPPTFRPDAHDSSLLIPPAERTAPTKEVVPTDPRLLRPTITHLVTWLPGVWLTCVPVMFLLLTTGVLGAERLRRHGQLLDEGPIAQRLQEFTRSMRLHITVRVGVCARVTTPILVGIVRPLILLPPAALTGWTPEQVEMVLWHELAHVRRCDNLVNLLQRVVEALWFFHPAVWVLSGWVRQEREFCCDAFVIAQTGQRRAYAHVLTSLSAQASLHRGLSPLVELQSTAMARHHLVQRVRHILGKEEETMQASRRFAGLILAVLLAAILGAGWWTTEWNHAAAQQVAEPASIQETRREPEPPPKPDDGAAAAPSTDRNSTKEMRETSNAPSAQAEDPVVSDEGARADEHSTIHVTGCRVSFSDQVLLASQATGVIATVPQEGDAVQKDETIITLVGAGSDHDLAHRKALLDLEQRRKELEKALEDSTKSGDPAAISELEIEHLKSAVETADQLVQQTTPIDESSVALAQEVLRAATVELKVAQRLKEKGYVRDAELQHKEFAVKQAELDLQRAQRALSLRRSALMIKAPFSGIVTKVMKSPGEGVQAAEPVVELVNPDRLRVEGNVHFATADVIRLGMPVTVRIAIQREQVLSELRRTIQRPESRLETSRKYDGPNHPDTIKQESELQSLRERLAQLEATDASQPDDNFIESFPAEQRQALLDVRNEIAKVETQHQILLKRVGLDHPRIREAESVLQSLRAQEIKLMAGLGMVPQAGIPTTVYHQKFAGRVTYIAPSVNPVTHQVRVAAEVDNAGRKLRPGLPATMTIHLSEERPTGTTP